MRALEMERAGPVLREVKVRSHRQSSLMSESVKQADIEDSQVFCKQEPVEDNIESGYETPTKSSRAGLGDKTPNGGDIKPRKKAWSPVYLEGLEGRFREHCEVGLCLDDPTLQQALRLFKESKPLLLANIDSIGTSTVEDTERLWGGCVLYVVKALSCGATVDGDKSESNAVGFTLSQLMRQTKISVIEFFKELPHFLVKVGPIVKQMYGDEWEKRLQVKEVQANFVHLTALFTYFKRVYQDFFLSPDTFTNIVSRSLSGVRDEHHVSVHMQFGWMLFLALRMHVIQQFSDLVTCTNALMAVMVILILHMPPDLRKFSLQDPVRFAKRSSEGVDLVASLCATYYAADEDVSSLLEKANATISKLFGKPMKGLHGSQTLEHFLGINPGGLAYLEGLMDKKSLAANLRMLEKDYEDSYQSRGGLDERMFINGEDGLLGTLSNESPRFSGSKRKFDIMASPVRFGAFSMGAAPSSPAASPWSSPVKHMGTQGSSGGKRPPSTPVTITMTTAKWLRTVITPLAAEPSVELQLFFRSCDRDISADVKNRAHVLLDLIFSAERGGGWQGVAGLMDVWPEQRKLEAIKLYYKVLGAMCRSEEQRLHTHNLTSLLSNERFHRCMIACSAELVLATHKTVTMGFPAVLEPAGITAFDLSKVIEYFVRHEETLPRELKRHLNTIEERILESMAWEKGSSMYNSLIVARPSLANEINRLCLLADPMPALENLATQVRPATVMHRIPGLSKSGHSGEVACAAHTPTSASSPPQNGSSTSEAGFLSPVKDRPSAFSAFSSPMRNRLRAPLQSAFASPQRPSPLGGGETCADTVINVFFQKALVLAAVRIRTVCERIGQPQHLIERVYKVFQHALHHETSLFFNRHIDQLVLCTIYGVCKVSKVDVKFRDIIHHYRSQPQNKLHVVRNVFIDQPPLRRAGKTGGLESGDIIKFYNDVFVHVTKKFLVQVDTNSSMRSPRKAHGSDGNDGEAPGSPVASIFSTFPDISPKKVSALHNVFVSPLRSSKVDKLMSPRTRTLYACVGESTRDYQSPSKDLTAINNRLNKRFIAHGDLAGWTLKTDPQ
ncbi:retinoblastoma-related protein-like isoform X1 [Physcomitrium patens]|uniref:Retinoblastoma-related protein3 n=1 Tax=Physcomitrium patens TaxID=3218 RepID=G1UDF6_PHYPA|nr:retinoblastoma-related protein isoform X1 [Physcomitrium patens]XP_024397289.1 retinoblastoma-related protein isoform X1 [Physcomitrium patens]XP_024397290.1 retinoblastoma-related protein isoform X1 [Physcomitrium patens]XP_024397292.1 retinoblastoma-related protein isoform X1 [Physcomitrium patens]XP_024397293.1 retinoblastoma-related protein isoform X1 [Physcomitrium patens]XP_024397294.1 retinoblastoma-related protein isoform X1 [Physcomitrium patens]XP_024397295.1 retinoblastoma-relat|eukprot:XP_024397288.1 retinoblastoma-related protein isoform X1 [Physcomitrella patens]